MERGPRGPYKKVPVDLDEVYVEADRPKDLKIKSFIKQVKDPYQVRIKGVLVEMKYAEEGPTMQELVEMAIDIDSI